MTQTEPVRRIVYSSRPTKVNTQSDYDAILSASQRNNGIDGVSGILWIEPERYLQVLEGPSGSVDSTFARILLDPRHSDIAVLDDREDVRRNFGDWTMAGMLRGYPDDETDRLRLLLDDAGPEVRRFFPDA